METRKNKKIYKIEERRGLKINPDTISQAQMIQLDIDICEKWCG